MRILVLFDLPVVTLDERRDYAKFRRFLIKEGFLMLQESVYSKICLNGSQTETCKRRLRKNKPPKGLVQILTVTERQYANMEFLVGENHHDVLNNDQRIVIL